MDYQDYDNFTQFVSAKAEPITLGFSGFIGDHTLGVGLGLVALFLFYKFFIAPIISEAKEYEDQQSEQ